MSHFDVHFALIFDIKMQFHSPITALLQDASNLPLHIDDSRCRLSVASRGIHDTMSSRLHCSRDGGSATVCTSSIYILVLLCALRFSLGYCYRVRSLAAGLGIRGNVRNFHLHLALIFDIKTQLYLPDDTLHYRANRTVYVRIISRYNGSPAPSRILASTFDDTASRDGGCATVFVSVVSILDLVHAPSFSLGDSMSGGSLAAGLGSREKVRDFDIQIAANI